MKRCPQCEFIYEDEQSLCDMDGVLLVFDSRTLPNLSAIATVPVEPKTQRRNRAVPAFATVILALVLGMVYYVSTHGNKSVQTDLPASAESTMSAVPVSNPPETAPTPAVIVATSPAQKDEEPKPVAAKSPATTPAKKSVIKATAPAPTRKPEEKPEEKKEESKVGSILKKTGRILKKPFKF